MSQARFDGWFGWILVGILVLLGLTIYLWFQSPTLHRSRPNNTVVDSQLSQVILTTPTTETGPVNLRTATATDLDRLSGIGPTRAQEIVVLRDQGKIRSVDDLQRVKGIGPKLFSQIKDQLVWQ